MRVKNFLKSDQMQHRDPAVRMRRVLDLDANQPTGQSQLAEAATGDDDVDVRRVAIERLADSELLCDLLAQAGEDAHAIRSAAESRLAALLEEGVLADEAVRQLLERNDEALAVAVAVHSANGAQRTLALERISLESALLQVVQHTRFHDTRQAAALRIADHELIREALLACRARDKVVARGLSERLDEINRAKTEQRTTEVAVIATRDALTALADSVWSPQHAGRLQALSERWQHLPATLTAEWQSQFAADRQRVQAAIDSHTANRAQTGTPALEAAADTIAPDDRLSAGANTVTQGGAPAEAVEAPAVDAPVDTAGENSAEAAVQAPVDPALAALQQALDIARLDELPAALVRWQEQAGDGGDLPPAAGTVQAHAMAVAVLFDPPFDVARARPQSIEERLKRVTTLLDTEQALTGIDMRGFVYLDQLRAHAGVLEHRLGKARQESADRLAATERQFAALSGMLDEGKWSSASTMFRRLQKKIAQMEPREKDRVADSLQGAERRLNEMADWQDFAARPKLEALCEAMEALGTAGLQPPALAKEVKSLQTQWKTLGASRAANELWPRFKTAGDQAFEPCRIWFDARRKEREAKHDAKQALCNALEQAADEAVAEAPDFKALQRRVQQAKGDWSRNRINDRKPDKALEERFSRALEPFEKRLAMEYDNNAALRQELVDKAKQLAEGEINQHVVNQTRRLQAAWKQIGVMRRRDDQRLWEAFNGHCRDIFKHQQATQREKYKASMAHVFRARDIIKSLKTLAGKGVPDEQQVQALVSEFQSLERFPEKDRKFLLRDFRHAVDACNREQSNRSRQRAEAEKNELARRLNLCEQLEDAVENPDSAVETLREDVLHTWDDSDVRLPRELAARLEKRRDGALEHLARQSCYDYEQAEDLRRGLLIKLEVETGSETPPEDKARRMQYQLANLQAGMTSAGVADKRAALAEIAQDWYGAPPVRQALRSKLESRFQKAMGH